MVDIEDENYEEYWTDEFQLFHNPNAKRPIDPEAFGGITQHFFEDGNHYSITPDGGVIASRTMIMKFVEGQEQDKKVILISPREVVGLITSPSMTFARCASTARCTSRS